MKEISKGDSQKLLQTSLIDKSLIEVEDVIAKLFDNLIHLLLTIKQTAVYINKNTMSVSDYLKLYKANNKDFIYLLSTEFENQEQYKKVKNLITLI
jgi:hypothetical protein